MTGAAPGGPTRRDGATVPRTIAGAATRADAVKEVRRTRVRGPGTRGRATGPDRGVTARVVATAGATATSRAAGRARPLDRSTDEATAIVALPTGGTTVRIGRRGGATTRVAGPTAARARATSVETVVATVGVRPATTGGTAEGTQTVADRVLPARVHVAASAEPAPDANAARSTLNEGRDAGPAHSRPHETTVARPIGGARGNDSTGRAVRVSEAGTIARREPGHTRGLAAGAVVRTAARPTGAVVAPTTVVRLTAGVDPVGTATTARRASPARPVPSRTGRAVPNCRTT